MMRVNTVPLREHLEALMREQARGAELTQLARTEVLRVTAEATAKRMDRLDELASNVLPREAFDEYLKAADARYRAASTALHSRIDDLRDHVSNLATSIAAGPPELPALRSRVEAESVTRTEYEKKHNALIDEISAIRRDIANLSTRVAVGPPELPQLERRIASSAGVREGQISTTRLAIAITGLGLTLGGLILSLIVLLVSGGVSVH